MQIKTQNVLITSIVIRIYQVYAIRQLNDKYHDIIEKYQYPSTMLLQLVYPQFLRELHGTRTPNAKPE
jgi:hypothetical protein